MKFEFIVFSPKILNNEVWWEREREFVDSFSSGSYPVVIDFIIHLFRKNLHWFL